MVSRAISEGLIARIQKYVANDLNSKIPVAEKGDQNKLVDPERVYILAFSRLLTSWSAVAVSHLKPELFYEIVHDGTANVTLVNVYQKKTTQQAII